MEVKPLAVGQSSTDETQCLSSRMGKRQDAVCMIHVNERSSICLRAVLRHIKHYVDRVAPRPDSYTALEFHKGELHKRRWRFTAQPAGETGLTPSRQRCRSLAHHCVVPVIG
ncbi:hypothetical protein MHYP_G00156840 [Metynnis hypsauchen]